MPNLDCLLITGGSGFVGRHLLPAIGKAFPAAKLHATHISSLPKQNSDIPLTWHQLDVTNGLLVNKLIEQICPTAVINLAAFAKVADSFNNAQACWQINLHGTLNLLEATARYQPDALFLQVGSADVYGASFKQNTPVTEQTCLHPLNPYAASKAAADLASAQFAATTSLKIIRARPFNHSGSGQSQGFVLPDFASQIARIEAGLQAPEISVGDLSAQRDFLHIDDIIRAYIKLLANADSIASGAAVNIASGNPVPVAQLLALMINQSSQAIKILPDPKRMRPSDIQCAVGDAALLRLLTDWRPMCSHAELVKSVLDDWRTRILK